MRLTEGQIRDTILHEEHVVRVGAAQYFHQTSSQDESLLPQVAEAVRRYGREESFSLVRAADGFVVTPAALSWVMDELRSRSAQENVGLANYQFAVALLLCDPCIPAIAGRWDEIRSLPGFPPELQEHRIYRLRAEPAIRFACPGVTGV